jgi:hypothetical protein
MVVGGSFFYNNSGLGRRWGASANDDNAIAPDKVPLFDGSSSIFANYTSYSRGINGIVVDILNPRKWRRNFCGRFCVQGGNDNNPAAWSTAPAPISVTRRAGAGVQWSGPLHHNLGEQRDSKNNGCKSLSLLTRIQD